MSSLVEAEVGDLVGMDRDLIKVTEMKGCKMLEGCQDGKSLVDAQFPIGKAAKGANLCQWCFAKAWKPRLMKSPKLRELSRIPDSKAAMHPIQ